MFTPVTNADNLAVALRRDQSEDRCLPEDVLVYRDREGGGYNVTRALDEARASAMNREHGTNAFTVPIIDTICTPEQKSVEHLIAAVQAHGSPMAAAEFNAKHGYSYDDARALGCPAFEDAEFLSHLPHDA